MAAENEILLFDENDDQVGTAYSNTELDAAIAAAESGYRIELGAGTFAASGQLSLDAAGITLVGAGDGTTTIQTANVSWGIYVTGDDVTISDLSVDAALTQNFGIKVNPADADPAASLSGLEISNVTVSGAQRSEIDLNGVDDSTLSNVTANGNGTAGVGIALSDSTGITLENIATTGNAWGSIGLYSAGRNWEPGTNGITFAGTYTHDEPTGIYADEEDGSSVSNIDLSAIFGTVYKVENDTFRAGGDQRSDDFTFFFGTEAEATAFALGLPAGPSDSVISTSATKSPASVGTETGETFVIAPGMSLQEAVDKAGAGDTILLRAGAYAESVTIPTNKAGLTIEGPQVGVAGTDAARAPGSATDEASLEGRIVVLADGVTIDGVRMTEGAGGGAFDLAAIHVQAENVTVQNSVFFRSGEADGDTSRGVINSVGSGDGLSVTQNAFTGFHTGTYVQGADGVTVAGNDYSGNFVGVSADAYTSGNANLSVTGNSFDNVLEDMGIGAVGGASWTGDISGNTFARGFFDYDPADNADLIGMNTYVPGAVTVSGSDSVYTSIQDAVAAAAPGATITVGAGTYEEDVVIDKPVTLVSADGAEATVIDGQGGAPGAITIAPNAGAVAIGTTGTDGFTVLGNDGTAAVENAAIYLDGAQDGVSIVGNVIEARGDAALLSEYNAAVTNLTVDGNAITGQTFTGSEPAGNGFSEQFSLDNVPRQLVTIGGGDNTDAVTFVNNTVSGTAGGLNAAGEPQGNTLVTIDASNSLISGNDFTGFTNRSATALRVRKDGTEISDNTFDASASGSPNTAYVYVSTDNPGPATNNTFVAVDGGQQLGGIGDDIFTGGLGDDTVVYNGNRADFAITFNTDTEGRIDGASAVVDTKVEDGDEGSDSLSGIETLQFADASIGFDDPIRVIRGGELIASFETLQAAVDGATEGDTILVGDGTYGPVSIDKSIALYAVNDGGAQIVGAGVNQGAAIRIEAGVSDVV
ncbi:nitrous oxidase accessory protein, partial [Roseivivax marinus]